MLPRMNQAIAQRPSPLLRRLQRVDDRGDLHEVGPGSGNEINAFYHVTWLVLVRLGCGYFDNSCSLMFRFAWLIVFATEELLS